MKVMCVLCSVMMLQWCGLFLSIVFLLNQLLVGMFVNVMLCFLGDIVLILIRFVIMFVQFFSNVFFGQMQVLCVQVFLMMLVQVWLVFFVGRLIDYVVICVSCVWLMLGCKLMLCLVMLNVYWQFVYVLCFGCGELVGVQVLQEYVGCVFFLEQFVVVYQCWYVEYVKCDGCVGVCMQCVFYGGLFDSGGVFCKVDCFVQCGKVFG